MPTRHRFQPPKGTRDFDPREMALRRHVESTWRTTAERHGFEEIDGPTYEHLELYTVKSGPGIVSELFTFRRAGGEVDYALRPEFTPTLARMVAADAQSLPKPTRWFSIASMFRAERPQRGRLREHIQWNVDVIGDDSARADAEIVDVAVAFLERAGFTPDDVRLRLSHRGVVSELLRGAGVDETQLPAAFDLLDRRDKLPPESFEASARTLGLAPADLERFAAGQTVPLAEIAGDDALGELAQELRARGLESWCAVDFGIVRGLAYYTGMVFEIHEATGRERAIAGGGRYDQLVELFGGPPTPAVGFAMGDVVIRLVMQDHGLLEPGEAYLPRPDAFVVAASDAGSEAIPGVLATLRRAGLHARQSYRSTRNVGKLLGDAGKARARAAVILGDAVRDGMIAIKDLASGEQRDVELSSVADLIHRLPSPGKGD